MLLELLREFSKVTKMLFRSFIAQYRDFLKQDTWPTKSSHVSKDNICQHPL